MTNRAAISPLIVAAFVTMWSLSQLGRESQAERHENRTTYCLFVFELRGKAQPEVAGPLGVRKVRDLRPSQLLHAVSSLCRVPSDSVRLANALFGVSDGRKPIAFQAPSGDGVVLAVHKIDGHALATACALDSGRVSTNLGSIRVGSSWMLVGKLPIDDGAYAVALLAPISASTLARHPDAGNKLNQKFTSAVGELRPVRILNLDGAQLADTCGACLPR